MKMAAHVVETLRCPGLCPKLCVVHVIGSPYPLSLGTRRRDCYLSCFTNVEAGPKRLRWDLNSYHLCAVLGTQLVSSPCFSSPTGSKMEQQWGTWLLVWQQSPSYETGSFIWGHAEPLCVTLSRGDNTTCLISLTECGEGLHQEEGQESGKLWSALSTQGEAGESVHN